ncbi:hypothetical protein, partial [Nonomuraea sp. SBT364]|uniref:hypothetical protein n=1 Tax=Nonomuraea sp. SBT364 TaxID=1580530 RepID=UPI00066C7981
DGDARGTSPASPGSGTAAPVARLDPCALLTEAQAGELLAGSPKPDGKACVWQDTATVKIKATGYPGDATAKDTMALYRRQAASDAGDSEDVMTTTSTSAVRAVPGLGDEAFAQDTGTASEFGDSATTVVWARRGRYVLQVDYRMPGRPEVTGEVRAQAAGATRHALANLP